MRLPPDEVEWSLFLPFLKFDAKSRTALAGVSLRSDGTDEAFVETDNGLLSLADLKRELKSLSDSPAAMRNAAKHIASGALHPRAGDPAKAWWISTRIDDPEIWHQIHTGKMTGLHLRGRATDETRKHDVSNELRLPKGQPGGGQWTTGSGTGVPTPAPTESAKPIPNSNPAMGTASAAMGSIAIDPSGVPSFFGELSQRTLSGLKALLTKAPKALTRASGAFAVFQILFIPRNSSLISSGSLPNFPQVTYRYDQEAGLLDLKQNGTPIFSGYFGDDGLFRDYQGKPFARAIAGDGIIIDANALKSIKAIPDISTNVKAGAASADDTETQESLLCPEPTEEDTTGRSEAANKYQTQITGMPQGFSILVPRPDKPGDFLDFDGCDEKTLFLLEAKGENYSMGLRDKNSIGANYNETWEDWFQGAKKVEDQIKNQSITAAAAGYPGVRWYFAERPVADYFRKYASDQGYGNIIVIWEPLAP